MSLTLTDYTRLDHAKHSNLLAIRNQDAIRSQMLDPKVIPLNEHLAWVTSLEKRHDALYFAVSIDESIAGGVSVTHIDPNSASARWGVFFAEGTNPLVSTAAICLLVDYSFNRLKLKTLLLDVKTSNEQAIKTNRSFGFEPSGISSAESFMQMRMDKARWEQHQQSRFIRAIKKQLGRITYQIIEREEP
jgi:RimJ/RimL family protein N-acetyltransferase